MVCIQMSPRLRENLSFFTTTTKQTVNSFFNISKTSKILEMCCFKKYEAIFSDLHNEFTRRFKDFQIIYSDLQLVSLPFTFKKFSNT